MSTQDVGNFLIKYSEMNRNLPPLIEAMVRPEFYADHPPEVKLRQTHISYVFLAGGFAYKVKKAIQFPFVDYSTLEKRHHFCAEEVRLNRRLATRTYLYTVRICQTKNAFSLEEHPLATNRIVEYAVKMNRLPEQRLLSSLIRQESVQMNHVVAIANKLAVVHQHAPGEKALTYGSQSAIASKVSDNFTDTRCFIGRTISRHSFDTIATYSEAFMNEHSALLASRVATGRVREGHGDLRAEHICLLDDDIEIFDCLEFDEGLRYNDLASELGFLSMDLDFLGEPRSAAKLESAYASATQDPSLATLLPFYKCYRAYVRGKVESLKSDEREVSERERRLATSQALRYFYLSSRYARGKSRPMVVIVCGMIATGKSTIAWLLSALTGFAVLSSDRVRKDLAGVAPTAHKTNDYQQGIYSEEFTRLTYERLLATAENRLAIGEGAIIDATFGKPQQRQQFLALASRFNIPVLFVECRADESTIANRLQERKKANNEISDANWEIYQRMRRGFASFSDLPENCRLPINTENELLAALSKLEMRF